MTGPFSLPLRFSTSYAPAPYSSSANTGLDLSFNTGLPSGGDGFSSEFYSFRGDDIGLRHLSELGPQLDTISGFASNTQANNSVNTGFTTNTGVDTYIDLTTDTVSATIETTTSPSKRENRKRRVVFESASPSIYEPVQKKMKTQMTRSPEECSEHIPSISSSTLLHGSFSSRLLHFNRPPSLPSLPKQNLLPHRRSSPDLHRP